MPPSQQFTDLSAFADAIDTETNAISARIDKLVAQIGTSMSQDEVDQLKAKFQVESDRLTVLGQDPAQPIPPTASGGGDQGTGTGTDQAQS